MSVETSNGKTEYGDKIDVKWFTKSLYEKKATLFSENIRNIQYTGEETIIKTQWMIEDNIQSGFIEYKINDKFKIMRNNTILTPYKQVGEECIYRVEVKNPKTSTQEEIKVINPQEYKEAANLVIHSFFSKESNYWNVEESTKWEELNQKLILESNKEVISWHLINKAVEPEIKINKEENSINTKTGEIMAKSRRGENSVGERNKNEQIIINVSNIPSGFLLASKMEGRYIPSGATDIFGTVTVFVKNQVLSNDAVNEYTNLGDQEIYLVRRNENTKASEDVALTISATSSIPEESRGDTRSNPTQVEIILSKEDADNLPVIGDKLDFIDPIIIDFDGGGIGLKNLEDKDEYVEFEMIPTKDAMRTAWLSHEANRVVKNKAAFLVYDGRNLESDEPLRVENTSQLFSEYFQSTDGIKKWRSGVEALRSLDQNYDGVIDEKDDDWLRLKLWFDDGDGIAEKVEIKHVSQFIESIDISDVELITTNPEWAEGNRVLRSFLATNNENIYTMYDIGLATRPVQKQTSIELDITERINITEGSDLGTIQINCEESIRWRNENKDNLTLLRLSGLPEEIKPSIGVKDELGDWLMTWKGLRNNSQVIELIQDSDWSGDATLQIIVSQLQDDGTIRSSNLENILLEVKAAADPPILIVQDQRVLEDQIVYLSNIIQLLESTDKDGSEKLGIKVEESKGLELMKINKKGS